VRFPDEATMRTRLTGFLLVLAAAACGDGAAPTDAVDRAADAIVNGQLTSGDPAVVYIDVGCSGTLVTPRIVLTACHCLEGVYWDPEIFFGSNIDQAGTWMSTIHHEAYPAGCIGDGDLAMLTLAQPGPAQPIPFNDRDLGPYIGQAVRIVGFGVTGEYANDSGAKREGTSTLADLEPGTMYCQASSPSATCYGDSGGPNFMTFEGKEYVVGTTSYGTEACGSGWDASARTDAHHDWLVQYVALHDPADCGADGQCASFCSAPDPDCPCANDGYCTAACADAATDPDCPDPVDPAPEDPGGTDPEDPAGDPTEAPAGPPVDRSGPPPGLVGTVTCAVVSAPAGGPRSALALALVALAGALRAGSRRRPSAGSRRSARRARS
jgi:trypsin